MRRPIPEPPAIPDWIEFITDKSQVHGFSTATASNQNGLLSCHWTVDQSGDVKYKDNEFHLDTDKYFLQLATAAMDGGRLISTGLCLCASV